MPELPEVETVKNGHSVNGYFPCFCRKFPVHQAYFIDFFSVFENTHGASIIQRFFQVKVVIQLYAQLFNLFPLCFVNLFCGAEISVFDVVFLKSLIVGSDHTSICYKETGHKTYGRYHQDKYYQVLSDLNL